MKVFRIVCMVLMIAMMQHTCLAEATLDNAKEWDAENKTITIFNEDTKTKLMTVKLISVRSDLCTFTEIYEVSNFEVYTPDSKSDFKAQTNIVVGSGVVTKIEWFSEQNVLYVVNVTDYGIKQVEEILYNNKTGKNETVLVNKTVITGYHDETRYKNVWVDYQSYDKEMKAGSVQRIKVVYHKIAELGLFQIQTIPVFRGVECPELTWWSGSWDRRRAILINNIGGDSVINYQLISVNLSSFEINATSSRIINNISGLEESFWNEIVDASGNLEYVWCNFSNLPSGSWINSTYYVYYQSSPTASSVSDGDATFLQYHGPDTVQYLDSLFIINNFIYELNLKVPASYYIQSGISNIIDHNDDYIFFDLYQPYDYLGGYVGNENSNTYSGTTAPRLEIDTFTKLKIVVSSTNVKFYRNGTQVGSTITTNLPDENMGMDVRVVSGSYEQAWSFIRKLTTNEPEPWTVGDEEEYSTPTPTPTLTYTPTVSPAQYDELDLPLILYILMISLLYLLIAFRHGVAAVELSFIYLIFAFFFLLFQTVTMSVNYIYLTLFLLVFLISIAGITKQGAD